MLVTLGFPGFNTVGGSAGGGGSSSSGSVFDRIFSSDVIARLGSSTPSTGGASRVPIPVPATPTAAPAPPPGLPSTALMVPSAPLPAAVAATPVSLPLVLGGLAALGLVGWLAFRRRS